MFILGLDNAGKTTMLYRIQNNKIIQMAPSLVCFGIYNLFVLWLSHDMQETPEDLAQIAVANFPASAKPLPL